MVIDLVLDEFTEFRRDAIAGLRQPLAHPRMNGARIVAEARHMARL